MMSIEHLTDDERATFLIGQSVRRLMIETALVPAEIRAQAWATYSAALDRALTPAEVQHITRTTSLLDLSGQWETG
jgi:hypothetical protein